MGRCFTMQVEPEGSDAAFFAKAVPNSAHQELEWYAALTAILALV